MESVGGGKGSGVSYFLKRWLALTKFANGLMSSELPKRLSLLKGSSGISQISFRSLSLLAQACTGHKSLKVASPTSYVHFLTSSAQLFSYKL